MTRSYWTAAAALTVALAVGGPPAHAADIKKQETAANLADLGKLIGAKAVISFDSDLPGAKEAEDVLKGFGMTAKDEGGIVFDPLFDAPSAVPQDRVLYYDDAGLKILSDGVRRYLDKNGREAFAFQSDGFNGIPEPTTWGLLLSGFAAIGAILRTSRRMQVPTPG